MSIFQGSEGRLNNSLSQCIKQYWGHDVCTVKKWLHLCISAWQPYMRPGGKSTVDSSDSMIGCLSGMQHEQCHRRQPVCVWWLGLGAWCSTPMQMASQMVDIYTTGALKSHLCGNCSFSLISFTSLKHRNLRQPFSLVWKTRAGWESRRLTLFTKKVEPFYFDDELGLFFCFGAWKCNPPKCKVHDSFKNLPSSTWLAF